MRQKNSKRPLKRKLSISLAAADEKIVNALSKEMGYYNFSLALRYIIREWRLGRDSTTARTESELE